MLATAIPRAGRPAGSQSRADLREQGPGGRRLESPSALSDLRNQLRLQDDRHRSRRGGSLTGKSTAACCSRTSSRRNRPTAGGSSPSATRRWRSCRILPAMRTKPTSPRNRPIRASPNFRPANSTDLAHVLKEVLVRFDNLWQMSFPYVLVLHQAPTDGRVADGFHFHIEFHPPLRSPNLLEISGRAGGRRRQLLERHLAGRESGRAAGSIDRALQVRGGGTRIVTTNADLVTRLRAVTADSPRPGARAVRRGRSGRRGPRARTARRDGRHRRLQRFARAGDADRRGGLCGGAAVA